MKPNKAISAPSACKYSGGFIGVAAAIAAGTCAYADIVYFENPLPGEEGHYDWHWDYPYTASWLDITQGPDNQSNLLSHTSVGQMSYTTSYYFNYTQGGAAVGQIDSGGITKAFTLGDIIDGSSRWHSEAVHVWENYYSIRSDFDESVRAYMAVKTLSGNYGWIAVERGFEGGNGYNLTAFAWAFETEPGVPILAGEIPAPGTLALLAFGAVMREKRKRN